MFVTAMITSSQIQMHLKPLFMYLFAFEPISHYNPLIYPIPKQISSLSFLFNFAGQVEAFHRDVVNRYYINLK